MTVTVDAPRAADPQTRPTGRPRRRRWPPWAATLRLARRDVLRHKRRSAVVITLILLPVLATSAVSVVLQTANTPDEVSLTWQLGAADARITALGRERVEQDVNGSVVDVPNVPTAADGAANAAANANVWTTAEVLAALPPGSRAIPFTTGSTRFVTDGGRSSATATLLDLGDPLADGIVGWIEGRPARSPDEVVVNPVVAEQGFGIGITITLDHLGHDVDLTVVGVAEAPGDLRTPAVWLLPADGGRSAVEPRPDPAWLVDTTAAVLWSQVHDLNRLGLAVLSRALVLDQPPSERVIEPEGGSRFPTDLAWTALTVVAVVLEVGLLAGPAFAVWARRRERDLAQVVAVGGEPRDIRRIVLATGLVLGLAAAVTGSLAGVGAASLVLMPWLESSTGMRAGPLQVPWSQLAGVVLLGTAAALAGASLPARAASRLDVPVVLSGRRAPARARLWWPLGGVVLLVLGVTGTVLGRSSIPDTVAAAAVLAVVGSLLLVPTMLRLAGSAAGRLPLVPRLALRDAARNTARTAPAVAAILAAVSCMTATAVVATSGVEEGRREYMPSLPRGVTSVTFMRDGTDRDVAAAVETVRRLLPGAEPEVRRILPLDLACDTEPCRVVSVERVGAEPEPDAMGLGEVLVDDGNGSVVPTLSGQRDTRTLDQARAALARGLAVVLVPGLVSDDAVTFVARTCGSDGECADSAETRFRVPAIDLSGEVAGGYLPVGAVPPTVAERLGVGVVTDGLLIGSQATPTAQQEDALQRALEGWQAWVWVERGYVDTSIPAMLLVLGGLAALVVLGATVLATALAAADGRPDLATLAAVGAAPSTRRWLTMAQAAVVGLVGATLGLAVGLLPGWAASYALTEYDPAHVHVFEVPWPMLGVVALGVPLLAALGAALVTPSRLPLVRRID